MTTGVEIATEVHPLGILPGTPHTFRIVQVDEDELEIQTEEHGAFVQRWNHTMKIEPIAAGKCRYSDHVKLEAGLLTLFVWLLANIFYRYRQFRWRFLASKLVHDA